jgi:hypothetical protein
MNGSRLSLSMSCGKWFGTLLAEKQIFHIGSVMEMNGAVAMTGRAFPRPFMKPVIKTVP